ncbi:Non-specific lipid-transfer protein 1 [Nymphaea thermarum]|nr:Non-specific lipid-transfer protein 1 [Nymphaea thermarum]
MSNPSSNVKLSVLVVVLVAMILSESMPAATAAVSCGSVYGKLTPCMSYVSGGGRTGPSSSCCGGIKSLNFSLKLRSDRQAACVCLKSLAARFAGAVNYGVISSLPKKCGVNLPYPISTSINCNRIG